MSTLTIPTVLRSAAKGTAKTAEMGEPSLYVSYTSNYNFIYNDQGSGADGDVGIWRPSPTDNNYFIVGDYAQGNYGAPSGSSLIVTAVNDDPDYPLLKAPIRYDQIWNDKGSGGDYDGSIWRPVAPDGYVVLGCVAALGYDAPSIPNYRCIRKDMVTDAAVGSLIWSDKGSGADNDVSLWQVQGVTGAFVAQGNYNPYTGPCFKLATI
ncbi:Vps62-related protein [Mucilaginibacter pocheonensis]|uniref:DUF946 domain-containing protein n=1 Tax=Mucilaginibacter pocheonensis TaxID=398050 RepID=A0ABU1T709_9SPHI|nr:Vps62-related protein [Mucilaginibacter pocheonensis]MDR6941123.1 hypothetical protein [Mucilaginibacter pocheonensis]